MKSWVATTPAWMVFARLSPFEKGPFYLDPLRFKCQLELLLDMRQPQWAGDKQFITRTLNGVRHANADFRGFIILHVCLADHPGG